MNNQLHTAGPSPVQQQAIGFRDGQMLVLAGPGSGKTFVITSRLRYLILEQGIPPESILTITFTRSAAAEMKQRAFMICPQAGRAIFGTFHSVFYQIIRTSGYFQGFTFLSPYEQKKMIQSILTGNSEGAWQECLSDISFYKNTGKTKEGADPSFDRIFHAYQEKCRMEKKLDFDDILVCCRQVLSDRPEILDFWQKRFCYVQIDEFQDINPVQYEIITLLCAKHENLFVVGDDDQAIYSFRGADPSFMRKFETDYPKAQRVCLSVNYRCGADIVKLAGKCISHNAQRFPKEIVAAETAMISREAGEHDETTCKVMIRKLQQTQILRFGSLREEVSDIVRIAEKLRGAYPHETVALLVRTNAQMEQFAARFLTDGEAFFIREKRQQEFADPLSLSFRSFLKYLLHGNRRKDLFAAVSLRRFGLSREWFETEKVDPASVLERCAPEKLEKCRTFFTKLEMAKAMDYYGALTMFLQGFHVMEDKLDEVRFGKGKSMTTRTESSMQSDQEEIAEAVDKLWMMEDAGVKTQQQALAFFEAYERTFLEQPQTHAPIPKDKIVLQTYHGAKGLEYDHVFLPQINPGIVPRGRMLTEDQMEEERRMFYVAMTRAKKTLVISYVQREDKGNERSVFIEELLKS
ncbi:MAG: ATP-dependent helicase [Lachnospiraceae bacterium]|nr:ATP-dependent helicase [Lachnospiraceae bacterium]